MPPPGRGSGRWWGGSGAGGHSPGRRSRSAAPRHAATSARRRHQRLPMLDRRALLSAGSGPARTRSRPPAPPRPWTRPRTSPRTRTRGPPQSNSPQALPLTRRRTSPRTGRSLGTGPETQPPTHPRAAQGLVLAPGSGPGTASGPSRRRAPLPSARGRGLCSPGAGWGGEAATAGDQAGGRGGSAGQSARPLPSSAGQPSSGPGRQGWRLGGGSPVAGAALSSSARPGAPSSTRGREALPHWRMSGPGEHGVPLPFCCVTYQGSRGWLGALAAYT